MIFFQIHHFIGLSTEMLTPGGVFTIGLYLYTGVMSNIWLRPLVNASSDFQNSVSTAEYLRFSEHSG